MWAAPSSGCRSLSGALRRVQAVGLNTGPQVQAVPRLCLCPPLEGLSVKALL